MRKLKTARFRGRTPFHAIMNSSRKFPARRGLPPRARVASKFENCGGFVALGNVTRSWRRTVPGEKALHFSASLAGKTYSRRITEISSSRLLATASFSPLSLSLSLTAFAVLRN